jgi:glutamate/aspartate transport system permease protein
MIDLDWSLVRESLPILWRGVLVTMEITGVAVILGLVLGTVLAVCCLSPLPPLRWAAGLYVNLFRAIPLVMILMWFYLIVPQAVRGLLGLEPQTDIRFISSVTAFVLFEAAYFSEIIRAGLKSIPVSQGRAALALGMTRGQALRLILLPQAFRNMTPVLLTQSIVIFQDSTLVYLLAVTDFFRTATNIGKSAGSYSGMVLLAGVFYFCVSFAASRLVDFFRARLSVKKAEARR